MSEYRRMMRKMNRDAKKHKQIRINTGDQKQLVIPSQEEFEAYMRQKLEELKQTNNGESRTQE